MGWSQILQANMLKLSTVEKSFSEGLQEILSDSYQWFWCWRRFSGSHSSWWFSVKRACPAARKGREVILSQLESDLFNIYQRCAALHWFSKRQSLCVTNKNKTPLLEGITAIIANGGATEHARFIYSKQLSEGA